MYYVNNKQLGLKAKAAAKADSRVTIDFVGSVDGEEFEGGKATDFVLFMGQGRMIPGFEEGIVGHKAGEQFEYQCDFPSGIPFWKLKKVKMQNLRSPWKK